MSAFDDVAGELVYRYRSGELEVDMAAGEARIAGERVALEPKPFALLCALIEQPGRVLSRGELLERLWGRQEHLSDNVLANAVMRLRKALGVTGALVTSVTGQGYRFDGGVERVVAGRRFQSRFELQPGLPVPGRPSLVLETPLGSSAQSEVWTAVNPKTHDRRVFKFCSDGERLAALKREYMLYRVLRARLGERDDYARVLDANFAAAPFFLECEYGGESLLHWSTQQGRLAALPLADRLALFLQIARSVADAHRQDVLHKDLKPGNVLVTATATGWHTRLSDFGSGRLLSADALQELEVTQMGMTLGGAASDSGGGSLHYLAPELFTGATPTRQSDLYALGVMLWQFVVGDLRRPMATGWEASVDDALLREDIAAATQGEPGARLATVDELVERLWTLATRADARRRQEHAEQEARRATAELARTRARRPWVAAVLVCLALGLVSSVAFWQRERAALRTSQAETTRAQAIGDFLTLDVLQAADVTELPPGGGVDLPALLARASDRAARRLGGTPDTEASVRATLGQLFSRIDSARAEAEFRRALALLAPQVPDTDARVVDLRLRLATQLALNTRLPEARETLARAERDAGERLQGDDELAYQAARAHALVASLGQQHEQALAADLQSIALLDRRHPERLAERFERRRNTVDAQLRLGRMDDARKLMDATLSAFTPAGVGEVNYARGQIQLAQLDIAVGRLTPIEPMLREARQAIVRRQGPDDVYLGVADALLGDLYVTQGELAKAVEPLDSAHAIFLRVRGPAAQATIVCALNRSVALLYGGQFRRAREGLEAQRAAMVAIGGASGPGTSGIDFFRAVALVNEGEPAAALALFAHLDPEAIRQALPGGDWPFRLQAERGRALVASGQRREGMTELEAGLAGMEREKTAEIFTAPLRAFRDAQPEHRTAS